jgi:phospholipid/cholesterol/gamma-HCH transport system substrate-binding protein
VRTVIQKHFKYLAMVVALFVIASAVGAAILTQQRFRFPLLSEKPLRYELAMSTAQAVTPGQGQTIQVAGVQIGSIEKVHLENGQAIVEVGVQRKYRDLIREDSSALLRPRTGLKDMYIQLFPALDNEVAEEGYRIPVANTLPDVELHDILAQLDERTRDYIQLLVSGTGEGLDGRGKDLAEVFRRFGPTMRDLGMVNRAVAQERQALRRAVTSMADLNQRLARNPRALTELVDASAEALGAFAEEDDNLRATLTELAPTLEVARDTLRDAGPFARELRPTSDALVPVMRALDRANPLLAELSREGAPILRNQIRPFVRVSRPVVRDLRGAARGLAPALPELRRSLRVVNRLFNMLAYNPRGREAPGTPGREEGYLYWLAWTAHQTINLINIDDGNGPMRPVFLTGTCTTLQAFLNSEGAEAALAEFGFGLSGIIANLCGNPDGGPLDLDQILDQLPTDVIEQLPVPTLLQADPEADDKVREALREADR